MKRIEDIMLSAVRWGRNWQQGNTAVVPVDVVNVSVFLHGNHIAVVNTFTGRVFPNLKTLASWPTPTIKSRLRALGVNVTTKNHVTYVDGVAI